MGEAEIVAVELVQEVGESTVDSIAAPSVWPFRKKRRRWVDFEEACETGGRKCHPRGGRCEVGVVRGGRKCSMKFLDADVK